MTVPAQYTAEEKRKRVFAIISASSGNLVEWFDFYVYSFASIYFASQFFPSGNATAEFLKSAAVFAVGFLMRPIGGWMFGRIADRVGRKKSMVISVLMMCAGSLAIAVLPTYASIGVAAPLLLLVIRMFQGLSVGGEYGTTATYMSEVALRGQRGFFSSFQYVTLIGGQLLAVLTVVILEQFLNEAELKAWGWRVPFVVGAVAALVSLMLRRTLHETSKAEDLNNKEAGTLSSIFKHHRAAFLTVLGYTAGGSLIFYTFTTYMQKYLVNTAGIPTKTASAVMTCALFVYMCMQPLFGMLADRIGRRHSMMLFGGLGTLATYPILEILRGNHNVYVAFALIAVALAIVSLYTSISGLVKAEMFPPEVRALGVGLSYAIANAIFGGSAEFVGLSFKNLGHENWFFIYVTVMMVIAFLVSMRLPKTPSYLHTDH
ncbi:MFS family transporter [Duganella callida]|uniref:Alpha-ketoglutarate permease n=1 Tax=Duganella callida TaxID=2561932 RepID=A0A4Y9SLT4_9BURK|nr:MFS family transporter [Duganella callida]TFW27625.1 MFS transporter [Duganella callida]